MQNDSEVKNCGSIGDPNLISGLGRSPGVGNDNPLQYSFLKLHRQRSVVGYSLWGHKESDIIE